MPLPVPRVKYPSPRMFTRLGCDLLAPELLPSCAERATPSQSLSSNSTRHSSSGRPTPHPTLPHHGVDALFHILCLAVYHCMARAFSSHLPSRVFSLKHNLIILLRPQHTFCASKHTSCVVSPPMGLLSTACRPVAPSRFLRSNPASLPSHLDTCWNTRLA